MKDNLKELKKGIICKHCRYMYYEHLKSGVRRLCRIDGHKIKRGKKKCKDFTWD